MTRNECLGGIAVVYYSESFPDRHYELSPNIENTYNNLNANPLVKRSLDMIEADDEQTLKDQIAICEIPAPTFREKARAEYYMHQLAASGLNHVEMDSTGNVFGILQGTGFGPKLLVAAHLDTVFPEETDVKVRHVNGKRYAPGIGDNSRGLAALLSVVRGFRDSQVKPAGDIVFCGNTGEEGLGDLAGIKAFFRDNTDIDGFIAIDGIGCKDIAYLATGSRRYEVMYRGPGGHSFGAFGVPSAIHAMGRAIAKISDLRTPANPKATFTVGVVSGGTSVNSIAAEATMLLDIRANATKELMELEAQVLEAVRSAKDDENRRWQTDSITVDAKLIGDRPAGSQARDSVIVQAACGSIQALGNTPYLQGPVSTDANIPIALGIPAICLGGGGLGGNAHSPDEWYENIDAHLGPQSIFLTILGLAGAHGICKPLLSLLGRSL
jgi:tripeptide aminopeptidase